MACFNTQNITSDACESQYAPGAGGTFTEFYAIDISLIDGYTTDVDGNITGLTFQAGQGLFKILGLEETIVLLETPGFSPERGKFNTINLTFRLYVPDAQTRARLQKLRTGRYLVIVKANDGNYYIAGLTRGLQWTEGENTTGALAADAFSTVVTMTSEEPGQLGKEFFLVDGASPDTTEQRLVETQAYIESNLVSP